MRLATWQQAAEYYADTLRDAEKEGGPQVVEVMRFLGRNDLWFLMTRLLNRRDMFARKEINPQWLFERVKDVQANPDGHLDLWAREHYKSTVITYGQTIRDILSDPERTFGIFSCTRPIAKAFLNQIKMEFEGNELLKQLYPDILWENPRREAPRWSLDSGIIVKRQMNPKESTVEAWGIVDGQPTSKHFSVLVYDDVVTLESVTTPEMIEKVTERWAVSLNLGAHGGSKRYIGTRYHFNDTYKTMMDRQAAKLRIHAATHNGKDDGEPVFLEKEALTEKRREMGPYVFGCQMLQDPKADGAMGFKEEWINWYDPEVVKTWADHHRYILVDPASEKKKNSDYTVMLVIALGVDGCYYLVDGIRDRLNLTERARKLFELHRRWRPIDVGYEKYGMQSDIEHIQYEMQVRGYSFGITELGGSMPKNDRIRRLIPLFEQGRIWWPNKLMREDYEHRPYNLPQVMRDSEYLPFPVCAHDDMMDCHARICDPALGVQWPMIHGLPEDEQQQDMAETEYDYLA